MKQSFLKVFGMVFLAAALITSCKKGDTGPAGAQGEKGDTGATGPKGDSAIAGIYYSDWTAVSYYLDTTQNADGTIDSVYFQDLMDDRITQDIVDKGVVKVYFNLGLNTDPYVTPLPYNEFDSKTNTFTYINANFGVGYIELVSNINAGTLQSTDGTLFKYQYRYVIIPGNMLTSATSGKTKKINWDNYAEVKEYLHLKN